MYLNPDSASVKFHIRGRNMVFYSPSNFTEEAHSGEAPDKKLQLEWVYPFVFNILNNFPTTKDLQCR